MKFRWETEFKETEVGEIPRDWEIKLLGDNSLFKIIMGQSPPSEFYNQNKIGIPFVQGKSEFGEVYVETKTYTKKCHKIAPPNSVLITVRAPVGELNLSKENTCIGRGVASLSFKDHDFLKNKFLYYSLKQLKEQLSMIGERGTTYDSVTIEELIKFPIPFPPISEQSRIATVLSWFDDLIENKKRQNEILEKVAMALFKNWFIDFEPFKNEEFVYNEDLGKEIPKGWEVDFINKLIDFDPAEGLVRNRIYPYIEMKHVSVSSMCCEYELKKMSGSGSKFRFGDTLLARITPCLENGKTAFVWFLDPNQVGFGSTEFIVMRGKKDFLMEFTYLLSRTDDFREFAINSMSGTSGRQRVEKEALKLYKIVIPPPPILQSFHSLVEPIFQKIILNQKQIMLIRKIRDRLLPLLVFGKLRVEEI